MSHLAISLSFNSPHFHCEISPSLIIYPSLSLSSFSIHRSLPPLCRHWELPVGTVLFCCLSGGLGRTRSCRSFRTSHLRCPCHMPEESWWRERIEQIFKPYPWIFSHTPWLQERHPSLTAHCLLPQDLHLQQQTAHNLDSIWWLSRHNGRQNENLQTTAVLSWLHFVASAAAMG